MPDDQPNDHEVAATIATHTGELLLRLRDEADQAGVDPWSLRDAGDWNAHRFIMGELARLRPDDAVLSEEGADSAARLGADRVWIVDPLDGTREFAEPGRPDWAVHVALVAGAGTPLAGAVALPVLGTTLATEPAPVVPDPIPADRPPLVVASRSRPPAEVFAVADAIGGRVVSMGSAGAKAMAVVLGQVDVYLHAGGQYEWDNCAPAAVALAAGLHASRLDGSPLVYNRPDPWLPDLLICRRSLLPTIAAVLGH